MRVEDTLNLFSRYETRLLTDGAPTQTEIPACVITGFLGTGKTTLLAHLLRNRGGLKLGILINEVGKVDLDSQLINVSHVHAAHGLPAPGSRPGESQLAGGCVCCSAAGGLSESLSAMREASVGQLDYLVVETSGVADAEPLAAALAKQGFRLETVVAVVDAEAGVDTLQLPIAKQQILCADVVVINKCDVATLGSTADVEDTVQKISPGVRMVRARFGQVPLPLLLDVEPVGPTDRSTATAQQQQPAAAAGAAAPSVHGQLGVLSHEAVLTGITSGVQYKPAGRLSKLAARSNDNNVTNGNTDQGSHSASDHGHSHNHGHQHSHGRLHDAFHTVSVTSHMPVSWALFQVFAAILTHVPGLYRSKGILYLSDLRSNKYIFHLSGRQRAECLRDEPWPSTPYLQLVMIGSDHNTLHTLKHCFEQLIALSNNNTTPASHNPAAAARVCAAAVRTSLSSLHERLIVSSPSNEASTISVASPDSWVTDATVELSVRGEPLHGVRGSEVAASILRKAGSILLPRLGLLLIGIPEPPALSSHNAGTTHGIGERIVTLQLLADVAHNPFLLQEARRRMGPGGEGIAGQSAAHGSSAGALGVFGELAACLPKGVLPDVLGCVVDGAGLTLAAAEAIVQGLQQCCVPVLTKASVLCACVA